MKKILSVALCAGAMTALVGCGTLKPLTDPVMITPVAQSVKTTEAMHKAILSAALDLNFAIKSDEPGVVILTYPSNTARASKLGMTARVDYTATTYNVSFVDSYGMGERKCVKHMNPQTNPKAVCVHRNASRWLANLSKDIGVELAKQ